MGADVTAISRTADKEAEARSFGANNFAYSAEHMAALKGTQELILNTVSAKSDFKEQVRLGGGGAGA